MSDTTDQAPAAKPPTITITSRVCSVMGDLGPVKKGGFNKHGNYRHSTVDDVYHAVRPLLARHGLDLRLTIAGREVVSYKREGQGDGLRIDYRAELRFESIDGAQEHWETRFLSLPYTGPQTDEIAQSYLTKQYLRARLKIETGDFEDETPLGAGADGESTAWRNTPGARKIRARIDAVLPQLAPSKVPAVELATEAARSLVELNTVAKRAEATLAADQAKPPFLPGRKPPAEAPTGPVDPPAEPPASGPTSDGYFEGYVHRVGEDGEGNAEWGAVINATPHALLPGARVKVAMRGRPGRMRCVVTELLDRVSAGVVCRTRPETAADVAADGGEA